MKKHLPIFILLIFLALTAKSQAEHYPVLPEVFDASVYNALLDVPDLPMPERMRNRSLPYKVNHYTGTPYYRTPFPQNGLSCAQSSTVGMCFTYEVNRKRGLPSNTNENLYPTHFAFNWVNGDNGTEGASYYHSIELLKQVGTPNQEEYGGTPHFGGLKRWMTGYDLYYSAMHNRINKVYKINIANAEGMEVLKNWMYDHMGNEVPGGCAVTYSGNRYPDATLPEGTEDAGMYVLTYGATTSSHSFTFLGYNDSVRYDYNSDGRYTNDEDINGDGVVDMRDWEIGALIMSESYFGATAWGNGGFCYVMYKAIADGYLWSDIVHVMEVNHTYSPLLTAKVSMTYTHRKQIKIYAGVSNDPTATSPEHIIDFPIFNYQGGNSYMQGGSDESEKTIEFGLDLTPLLNHITSSGNAKLFLQVYENDPNGIANGTVDYFSIIDYSNENPIETSCPQQNVPIVNHGVTTLSVGAPLTFSPPIITTTQLNVGQVMSDYEMQLEVAGGTPPYEWSFDTDYRVEQSVSTFPAGGTTLSNNTPIPLNFTFNFYGEEINTIYGNRQGLMIFQPNFATVIPYANVGFETHLFYNSKCIAPYLTRTNMATQMQYINGSDYATIIWIHNDISHAATIHEDGRIVLQYSTASGISPHTVYACGVSLGDNEHYTKIFFDNGFDISPGLTYTLNSLPIPDDFQISTDGLLTGMPTEEYAQELLHFKVKDNKGLVAKESFPFYTDGVQLDFIVHTPNNDLIEYNEDVTLDMIVENPKQIILGAMTATATCNDPYITLIEDSCQIPSIDALDSITIFNAFSFSVAPNIPDEYTIRIDFRLTSDEKEWNYFKRFIAYAPRFIIEEITVSNSNEFLSYNDQAEIGVSVRNFGHATGNNLTFTATSSDPNITITNNTQQNIQLAAGAVHPFTIDVTTGNSIPESYETTIMVSITGDQGFQDEIPISLPIYTIDLEMENLQYDEQIIPGSERAISFSLKNRGLIPAQQVNVSLSMFSSNVTVITPAQNISNLPVTNSQAFSFTVAFEESCEYGEVINGEITISGNWGLHYTIPVTFNVGEMVLNFENGSLIEPFSFEMGGTLPWYITQDEVYEGEYSVRSGQISHGEHSDMEVEVGILAAGEINFAYKVSSEANWDLFTFSIDDVVVLESSGDKTWQRFSYPIATGIHRLKWSYTKDNSVSHFSDAVWLDDVQFPSVNGDESLFVPSSDYIIKNIYRDQIEEETFIIRNDGGKLIDYRIFVMNSESKSITGSYISTDVQQFTPGETVDIPFTLHATTPDMEWIKRVEIQFPEGFTVNSASDIIGQDATLSWMNITGVAVNTIWTIQTEYGAIKDGEHVNFTVNVTIDENWRNPAIELPYILTGDIYGNEPHTVSDVMELSNSIHFWLNVTPLEGRIITTSEQPLTLTYNSHDLELGTYFADLVFITPKRNYTVPVQLNVIDEVDSSFVAKLHDEISLNCYPNPFTDKIVVELNTLKSGMIEEILLLDATGKSIQSLGTRRAVTAGKSVLQFSIPEKISTGVYFIQVKMDGKLLIRKVMKQ